MQLLGWAREMQSRAHGRAGVSRPRPQPGGAASPRSCKAEAVGRGMAVHPYHGTLLDTEEERISDVTCANSTVHFKTIKLGRGSWGRRLRDSYYKKS